MTEVAKRPRPSALLWAFGLLLAVVGLVLAAGGIYLISLGGSWYYGIAGLLMLVSAVLTFRGRAAGLTLFLALFAGTVVWSFWEAGLDFWALVPRLVAPVFMAALALLLLPAARRHEGKPACALGLRLGGLGMLAVFAGFLGLMFVPHNVVQNDLPIVPGEVSAATETSGESWLSWGKTTEGTRFSTAGQITPENVGELEVAWTAHTGFVADQSKDLQDQNTPLYVDGTLYQCAAASQVTALDGTTGEIKWQFDPEGASPLWKRCRTMGYYEPPAGDDCGPRIVMTTTDMRLISLKAETGEVCESFGEGGTVDLAEGMTQLTPQSDLDGAAEVSPLPGFLAQTTGPFIGRGKIVLGGWVADNISRGEPSGVVRAFNALTGELEWAWDLGNPEITKLPPEGEGYTKGTPNVWSGIAIDEELGMVYLPMGNATPDYYGGARRDIDDEYGAALVALNLDDGREAWHFSTVHHDIWDYDLPAQPALADIPDGKGGTDKAIIQVTKRGQIFVLDRRTGTPLKKVVEKPVPASDGKIEGEYYSETQPYSVEMPTIAADHLTEASMWGATPIDQMLCRIMFRSYRYEGEFTTQSTDKTLMNPGNGGGFNWASVSYDQTRNRMMVVDMRMPTVNWLIPRDEYGDTSELVMNSHGRSPQFGLPYGHDLHNFMSPLGVPCITPPWGMVSAIDLATGQIAWQQPAGTSEDTPLGTLGKSPLKAQIGMPGMAGLVSTKSGLSFHSGTQDYYLRAYDTETGDILWKGRLPSGSQAAPMTYIGKDGRQYVVLTAGGARYNPFDQSDWIIAYALPKK
ncbi:membrane-bound PQQ-dependent dehydrogenase, glucose/quinate/shikimate family [Salipiger sp. H15]|uniref:Membrane-bound PQQ-dependent dehydrogenase, glucose/quinate/shikimate family n=1 Tax=Alloyangia sp. H15 TaxID=3029062 RepID=A0AAU8AMF5_9RHOB